VVNIAIVSVGCLLLVIAVIGYILPMGDIGLTVIGVDQLCSSGFGQLGQAFSGDAQQICGQYKIMALAIYGLGLLGIILIIVGSVVKGNKTEKEEDGQHLLRDELNPKEDETSMKILKERYAKGEISKEEFDDMKKNLEK